MWRRPEIPPGWEPTNRVLYDTLIEIGDLMALNQEQFNDFVAEVRTNAEANSAAHSGLASDFAALDQQIADLLAQVPEDIDTTGMVAALDQLRTSTGALQALDESRPEPPEEPAP